MEVKTKSNPITGKITISRSSSPANGDTISIYLVDDDAVMEFLTVSMSLEDFASAITGVGRIDCKFNTRRLDVVGKVRMVDYVKINYPYADASKSKLVQYAENKAAKLDGETSINADSRDFSLKKEDGYQLNFRKIRYVDRNPNQETINNEKIKSAFKEFYNKTLFTQIEPGIDAQEKLALDAFKAGFDMANKLKISD